MYVPDRWEIIRIQNGNTVTYRVIASWVGGYLDPDHWRMSSGITKIDEKSDRYEYMNRSGSTYVCYKSSRGMSSLTSGLFNRIYEDCQRMGYSCEVVDPESFKLDAEE
jgi:hypothetical protein